MNFIVFSHNDSVKIKVEDVSHIRHDKAKEIFSDEYMELNGIRPTESYILFYLKCGGVLPFNSDYRIFLK